MHPELLKEEGSQTFTIKELLSELKSKKENYVTIAQIRVGESQVEMTVDVANSNVVEEKSKKLKKRLVIIFWMK